MRKRLTIAGLALATALGGCGTTPAYRPPVLSAPPTFKEAGPWVSAAPALPADGRWWTLFSDPVLDGLERRIASDNPTLQGALARYEAAQAYVRQAGAGLLPSIGVRADVTQNRQSDHRPLRGNNQPDYYAADTLSAGIGWEPDLWGGLHARVAASRAEAQASADELAATRLALETELARRYVTLRGLDAQARMLGDTVHAYAEADALIRRRYAGGIASGIDVARSGALLADAHAQLADIAAARALIEHAIASLVGENASSFTLAPADGQPAIPALPGALPSTLLQRRPDIAAAERRMFAANAGIGVAHAAFFPSITLGGSGGVQNTALAGLVAAPNTLWSIGPSAVLSIFDGGRRRAALAAARARWDESTADYRGRVLTAFQQVEDAFAQLAHFSDEAEAQATAVQMASEAEQLALNRYEKGVVTYLDVATAQATALQARRKAIDLQTRRLEACVGLVGAVGGGWHA